jgi:hypothetical protein
MKNLIIISLLLIGCGSEKEQTFVCDCKQKEKVEALVERLMTTKCETNCLSLWKVEDYLNRAYMLYCTKVDSNYTPPQDTTKSGIGLDYCLTIKIKVKI